MSKARQKGTEWEGRLLLLLREVFGPHVERAGTTKGIHDEGDFLGVPWLHEAKKTDVPHFLQWAKTAQRKSKDRWAILWSGDQRKKDGPFVMVPLAFYLEMAHEYHNVEPGYTFEELNAAIEQVSGVSVYQRGQVGD